ncbi:MAG TPA: A/G-specific adenine glycosylase [Dehalococcoidia bacterium]|nr:A/G-specific adenine glycosylase [Dehalococcoidia bacterium]
MEAKEKRRAGAAAEPPPPDGVAERLPRVQAALLAWFDAEQIALPWRQGRSPYAVLVSEFMLQQTQRERVIPKFLAFMERFPDLRTLAAASTADVIRAWSGLGYNSRALRLQQIARQVVTTGGALPSDVEALRCLPGVGEYTAQAISCFAFDEPVACVDTNVRRVLARIFGAAERLSKAGVAVLASRALVRDRPADWNGALMDLGARICRARAPLCGNCPVARWCAARAAFSTEAGSALPRVAEAKPGYRTASRPKRQQPPFTASDRYLRGRIVAVLVELPDGATLAIEDLAVRASGMALPPQTERVRELASRLVREGLIALAENGAGAAGYRLPA